MPALLNIREFSAALGVSVDTVRKWCCYGLVPFTKLGKTVRFTPETLEHIRVHGLPSTTRPKPHSEPVAPALSTGWTRTLPPAA